MRNITDNTRVGSRRLSLYAALAAGCASAPRTQTALAPTENRRSDGPNEFCRMNGLRVPPLGLDATIGILRRERVREDAPCPAGSGCRDSTYVEMDNLNTGLVNRQRHTPMVWIEIRGETLTFRGILPITEGTQQGTERLSIDGGPRHFGFVDSSLNLYSCRLEDGAIAIRADTNHGLGTQAIFTEIGLWRRRFVRTQ